MNCCSLARPGGLVLATIAAISTLAPVAAQGHCALRKPKESVFRGFPEADSFRAVVRDVDRNERSLIDANLPFPVHFNEIGNHTLYVALRSNRPIGIAHVRSEESRWGLVEIVWYFELDMTVRSFRFQRVRSRHGPALEKSAFAQKLVGRDFAALRALLTSDGGLADEAKPVPERAESLALTVVRSSLKTMIVTGAVWQEQLQGLSDLELAMDLFPGGRSTKRLVIDPEQPSPFASGDTRYVETLHAVVVRDGRGRALGTAVETRLTLREFQLDLRWSFADDKLLTVTSVSPWPDEAIGSRFRELGGRFIETLGADRTDAEGVAAEVLTLVRGLVHER